MHPHDRSTWHHAAQRVLSCYPLPFQHGVLTSPADLPHGGGFSGARIFRLELPQGPFCLRAWPPGESSERIGFCHSLMHHACAAGLTFIPGLVRPGGHASGFPWTVAEAGRLWDLSSWLPGQADFWSRPTPARLDAACHALAQLHTAWQGLFPHSPARCPAIERRLALAARARSLLQHPMSEAIDPSLRPPLLTARHLLAHWLDHVLRALHPWQDRAWPLQPCLCDVWHDHLLFESDELTGLVDYGAARIDHVAVDLSRLLGSLVEEDTHAWQAGLRSYRTVRSLTDDEESLARVLDRTGALLALASWLHRLGQPAQEAIAIEGARLRIERLTRRIAGWKS